MLQAFFLKAHILRASTSSKSSKIPTDGSPRILQGNLDGRLKRDVLNFPRPRIPGYEENGLDTSSGRAGTLDVCIEKLASKRVGGYHAMIPTDRGSFRFRFSFKAVACAFQ